MQIRDIDREDIVYVNDSLDVKLFQKEYQVNYDSFFISTKNPDEVYGMYGIVPWLSKEIYPLEAKNESVSKY